MDPWEQKLKDSGIIESISAFEEKLDEYNGAELSIEDRGYIDKIRAASELAQTIIENADPRTINYSAVSPITNNFNQAASYIDSWSGGVNPTYLSNHAMGQIDAALQQIPLLEAGISIPEAKAAITNLRRSAARQNTIVNEITDKIRAKGSLADETIDEKIVEFAKEVEAQAAAAKTQLETVSTEAGEIAEQLDEIKTATNKLATEQNETFNAAQTERAKQFDSMIKEQQDEAYGVFTSISEKVTTEVKDVKVRAETSANLADEARVKSEELLGIVSQNALISDYSKNGLHEQKMSRIWQWITVGSLMGTIGVGALLALDADGSMSWQKMVARFGVLIATGGLAAYAATQASEHKQAQRHSEHLSLQLSAVRPYLAGIDDKIKRDGLLLKLAEKFFSEWKPKGPKSPKTHKKQNVTPAISSDDLPGLIGAIISLVNTTNKK